MDLYRIALRKDYLEVEVNELKLLIDNKTKELELKDSAITNKDAQIALLNDNVQNYKELWQSELDNKPDTLSKFLNTLKDIGIILAAFAGGYLIGSL